MKKIFDKNPDTIFRVINGKPFIMNYKTGNVMTLNELGSVIWEKLPDFSSKIIKDIASEYDVSKDEVQKDVLEFLDLLKKENLVLMDHKERFPRNLIEELVHLEKIEKLGIQECIPIIAKFELLYHCNLNCVHCFNITERWRKGTLETRAVKQIIDKLYDIGTMLISFTGGEIFLRKDIWDIIEYADQKNFLIELLTNASLITEEDVERLKHFRISNVQISIYSHIPEIHDSITCGSGSFKESIRVIRSLAANKINTSIVTPLMKMNFQDYEKLRELANQVGVKHEYYPDSIFERNNGSGDVCDLRLSKKDISKFYSENPDDIPYKKTDTNQVICHAGTNQCSISPFGDVFPCFHNILPMNLGNLMNRSLEDIWAHSKELRNLRNLKISHLNNCPGCPAIYNCSICPGMNMRANNKLLEPARICCDYAFSAKEAADRNSIDLEKRKLRNIKNVEDFH